MRTLLFPWRKALLAAVAAVALTANAIAQLGTGISVSPSTLQFLQVKGGKFAIETFVITNTMATGRLTGTVENPGGPFQIISGGGAFDLGAGESQIVVVRFTPSATRMFEDSIAITHNASGSTSPMYVQLRGTGQDASIGTGDTIRLGLSTQLLNFGNVRIGQTTQRQLTVTNNSDSARLTGFIAATADASFMVESGSGAFSLAPGESRVVTVRFSPTVAGAVNGMLNIAYNSTDSTGMTTVAMIGTGLQAQSGGGTTVNDSVTASLLTEQINFGNVKVGQTSQRYIVLRNTSDSAHLTGMVGNSTDISAPFSVQSGTTGSFTLAPGETRAIMVNFAPTASGSFIDTIQLMTNVTGSTGPMSVVVRGSAIDSTNSGTGNGQMIAISPGSIEFGGLMVGQTMRRSITLSNPSTTGTLMVNVANPAAPFFLSTTAGPMTLGPGETRTIFLNYTPSFAGTFNDNLAIQYTGVNGSGTSYISLNGSASTVAAGVEDNAIAAAALAARSFPNPFTTSTTIGFTLNKGEHVSLKVYNTRGEEMAVLADRAYAAGDHSVVWDARGMGSGLYLVRLQTDNASVTSYLTLTK